MGSDAVSFDPCRNPVVIESGDVNAILERITVQGCRKPGNDCCKATAQQQAGFQDTLPDPGSTNQAYISNQHGTKQ